MEVPGTDEECYVSIGTKVKWANECEFARSRPPCDNQKIDRTFNPPKKVNCGIAAYRFFGV